MMGKHQTFSPSLDTPDLWSSCMNGQGTGAQKALTEESIMRFKCLCVFRASVFQTPHHNEGKNSSLLQYVREAAAKFSLQLNTCE